MSSDATVTWFRNRYYFRLNWRRFEHLATLHLPIEGRRVLEVGAGIGDHTGFFLDRGCRVTVTEGRAENFAYIQDRFRGDDRVDCRLLDLDEPSPLPGGPWSVGYCFGVLYHLTRPAEALAYLSPQIEDMLLLETVCSLGDEPVVRIVTEDTQRSSQSLRDQGCRPTRSWVMQELRKHFRYAYATTTQPWHPEFELDWPSDRGGELLVRAVFVASRAPLESPRLTEYPLAVQERC